MSLIKSTAAVWTYDISLETMRALIAQDLHVPANELTVDYVLGDIGPSDPMDRFPTPRGVVSIKVYHKQVSK